jgi:MoxR-like ATPase
MTTDIRQISKVVEEKSSFVRLLLNEFDKVIVGQRYMLERMLVAILSNGHILIEGVPGLAKTTAVTVLAQAIQARFQRIQFTPDLLPADLTGTQIYRQSDGEFYVRKGPIFANIILADEINRAPAKVQSALLEAMQERQVTIGDETFSIPQPFLVLATQNPIEQEGTYPLPEAQLDRFMLKIQIDYPTKEEERQILDRMAATQTAFDIQKVISPEEILDVRSVIDHRKKFWMSVPSLIRSILTKKLRIILSMSFVRHAIPNSSDLI